jgi:hypothetical protein
MPCPALPYHANMQCSPGLSRAMVSYYLCTPCLGSLQVAATAWRLQSTAEWHVQRQHAMQGRSSPTTGSLCCGNGQASPSKALRDGLPELMQLLGDMEGQLHMLRTLHCCYSPAEYKVRGSNIFVIFRHIYTYIQSNKCTCCFIQLLLPIIPMLPSSSSTSAPFLPLLCRRWRGPM